MMTLNVCLCIYIAFRSNVHAWLGNQAILLQTNNDKFIEKKYFIYKHILKKIIFWDCQIPNQIKE